MHEPQTITGALNLVLMLKRLLRGVIRDESEKRDIENEVEIGLMVIFFSNPPCSISGYKLLAAYR